MKSLKRVIAVGVVAALASFAFAIQTPGAGADHTEPRLTLDINPDQGLVGQNIHAIVPQEYKAECLEGGAAATAVAAAFTAAAAGQPAPIQQIAGFLVAALAGGATTPAAQIAALTQLFNSEVLFVLAFVDPVTQDPVIDERTGEEAIAFWDPITGQGDILAPQTARPSTYFVAAVCLGLKDPAALAAAVTAAIAAVQPQFAACVAQAPPFSSPECRALLETTLENMVRAMIDEDPRVAWVAPFCLLGDNLQTCAAPPQPEPAAPVAAQPTFAG